MGCSLFLGSKGFSFWLGLIGLESIVMLRNGLRFSQVLSVLEDGRLVSFHLLVCLIFICFLCLFGMKWLVYCLIIGGGLGDWRSFEVVCFLLNFDDYFQANFCLYCSSYCSTHKGTVFLSSFLPTSAWYQVDFFYHLP